MSEKVETTHRNRGGFDPMVGRVVGQFVLIALVMVVMTLSNLPAAIALFVTGLVLLVVGLIEITHRRRRWQQAEAHLRDVEEKSRNWRRRLDALLHDSQQSTMALSKMMDGVVMLSPELRILLMNKAAHDLFALTSSSDYLDRTFTEVVRVPEINRAVRAAQAGDGSQEVTVEIHDQSSTTPIRLRVDRVADRDNSNVLLTIRDETAAHRVEAMRREFVANFSHEIKTPIAAIKGYGETAELAIDDDPTAATHFLRQIQGQCLRLERLVADMMQVARAQSGRKNLRLAAVNLYDIIAESMKSLRPVAESRSIELSVDDTQEAMVIADHEATLVITNNLISNAIHYTPPGGHVHVGCHREDPWWILTVQDDGEGIAENEQERIFERFYRVDRSRESASGGTGIGLSIVKNLTVAQDGKIRLESTPGEGALFEISLPVAAPADPESSPVDETVDLHMNS